MEGISYRMKLTTVKPWRICWHWPDSLLHTLGLLQPEDNQCESSWDLEVGSTHPPGKTCRFLIILKLPKLVGQTLSTGNQVLRTHSRPSSCWTREQREGWFLFSVLALLLPTLQLLRIGLGFWWLSYFSWPFNESGREKTEAIIRQCLVNRSAAQRQHLQSLLVNVEQQQMKKFTWSSQAGRHFFFSPLSSTWPKSPKTLTIFVCWVILTNLPYDALHAGKLSSPARRLFNSKAF